MTQNQLERLCREWQRRLRLQDWDVLPELQHYEQVDGAARNSFNRNLKTSRIRIATLESVHQGTDTNPQDIEQCLVHELLHLHFPDKDTEGSAQTYEAAIDQIAWALVRAKRGQ